jgi:HEAT repeat
MDFSSTRRALESLARRQPPLDEKSLQVAARQLQDTAPTTSSSSANDAAANVFLQDLNTLLFVYDIDRDDVKQPQQEQPLEGDDKEDDASKNPPTNPTTSRTATRWEPLAVGLYLATETLQQQQQAHAAAADAAAAAVTPVVYMEGPRVPAMLPEVDGVATTTIAPVATTGIFLPELSQEQTLQLCQTLHQVALNNLEHNEPRVRTLVAKSVGAYCKVQTSPEHIAQLRHEIHEKVVTSIRSHITTGRDESVLAEQAKNQANKLEEEKQQQQQESQQPQQQYSKSSTGALDDTTGWRALETNWQCLASLISALGAEYMIQFSDTLPQVLQDCQYSCLEHLNRHVRAAGFAVLEQLVVATAGCAAAAATTTTTTETTTATFLLLLTAKDGILRTTITDCLKAGLADNWSQVRMAASVLCRVFFTTLQGLQPNAENDDAADDESFADLYRALLPPMCLNRFYLAQGVKLYSHETWKLVFKTRGLSLVVRYLPAVCRYYVKNCDADNHVVREAACQAIAELGVRLSARTDYIAALEPQVPVLLQALLMCFHDESWPVRDEACLACGLLCRSFPEECRPELKTLWERWTEQLTDTIWSVREDAAVALGDALDAYGAEFLVQIRELMARLLPSARLQPSMTQEEFKARQNSVEAHTDAQLYSCGSLAPKLKKKVPGAGRIGGCSSCDVTREKAPWEATDGCIYLIREVVIRCGDSNDPSSPPLLTDKELVPLLRELADVCRVRHFPQGDDLRTTLWRNLPLMARALGKDRFKRHYMELFMDLLFYNLDTSSRGGGSAASQLSYHAAGQCAEELSMLVGPGIFRGRLEEDCQREILDQVLRERQCMPRGPADDAAFSPYGPPGLLDHIKP